MRSLRSSPARQAVRTAGRSRWGRALAPGNAAARQVGNPLGRADAHRSLVEQQQVGLGTDGNAAAILDAVGEYAPEQINRLEIRAPVSGTVLGLAVTTPRSVIRPADPLLYLIPQDRPLVINAQVQTIHIDEVHVGQKVRLIFPAFSARTTPETFGHVVSISADALLDERAQVAFYKAEIVLDAGELERLQGLTLVPGMPVEAFIETGARSPMAYLLKPFTDYFKLAFREQ